MIKLGLVHDHVLFCQSIKLALERETDTLMQVLFCVSNREELMTRLEANYLVDMLPDLLLLDIQMPVIYGRHAIPFLQKSYPSIKVICLSPFINENLVANLLERGAQGILSKNADLSTLTRTINAVCKNKIIVENQAIQKTDSHSKMVLSERQVHFLHLCASDMSYKEIAAKMQLSYKTIDNYRDDLFRKLNTRSRTGLALYAIRYGLASC